MTHPSYPDDAGLPELPLTWRIRASADLDVLERDPRFLAGATTWTGHTGSGVRVCVVDSGIGDHPLVGPVQESYEVVRSDAGTLVVQEAEVHDSSGHGTACAGIIRSRAPECHLASVRVLSGLRGGSDILLAGIRWAVDGGFDVVNLSLSTKSAHVVAALREVAELAYFRGVLLVCSAHNLAVESYPWRFSSTISVGSHADTDPERTYYNPRPPVEFLAAGQDIRVAWLGGRTRTVSGNSFATPRVAGMCAQILGAHPGANPFEVKTMLCASSVNVRAAS